MELTQLQKTELKNIETSFQAILKYSEECGIQIDELYTLMTFPIFEFAQESRIEALNLSTSRQRIFEKSKVAHPGKNSYDVSL